MKKRVFAVILAAVCAFALTACGDSKKEETASSAASSAVSEVSSAVSESSSTAEEVKVMTYDEYMAAALDTMVCVETYVQAKQSWWQDSASVYCQTPDEGAYFLYGLACTEEQFNTDLAEGNKIRVTGYKSEWAGEVEITDATYEPIPDDVYWANPMDLTDFLGTDELIDYQNIMVAFSNLTVADKGDGAAFLYKWDGSGEKGDDLYFDVTDEKGGTYTFVVESYLCGQDTEVYQAVENLKVGDVIDVSGFLYWYEGPNPHITSVTVQ